MRRSSKVINVKYKERMDVTRLKLGMIHKFYLHISSSKLGTPWKVPVIVAKGSKPGPVLGITAAIHGDELNGLSAIFRFFEEIKLEEVSGTIIAVPVCNIPGYLMQSRYFSDGRDLNRFMPGKKDGTPAQRFNYYLTSRIFSKFDYHLDLHTATTGKANSLYIRTDLSNDIEKDLAFLQKPQIILSKKSDKGTLRHWAIKKGIPSLTIEIGDPNVFQDRFIEKTIEGITNTMAHLKMIDREVEDYISEAVVCTESKWIKAGAGGVLDLYPKIAEKVSKGDILGKVYNIFGEVKSEIIADFDGVVVGKTKLPTCEGGENVIHLGVLE